MSDNILVIKLSALGDFIIALGAMQAIREHHKGDKITLLTTSNLYKEIAEKSGYFDEVVTTKRTGLFGIGEWFKMRKFFNAGNFKRVYDLQMRDRTKIYYHLFKKKPEWSGIIKSSPIAYKKDNLMELHAFKRHEEVLKAAGIEKTDIPDISWLKTDISEIKRKKEINKPFIMLIPGSSAAHAEKRWSDLRYSGIALKFIKDGYDIVVAGGPDEVHLLDKIKHICPKAKVLSPKISLYDIYTIATEAAGIITNDTGPGHLAALSNKPTISLFNSKKSSASQSAPIGKNVRTIEADDMDDILVKDVYDLLNSMTEKNTTTCSEHNPE